MKRYRGRGASAPPTRPGSFSFDAGWTGTAALWAKSTVPVLASTAIADVRASERDGERSDFVSRAARSPDAASGDGDRRRRDRDGAEREPESHGA